MLNWKTMRNCVVFAGIVGVLASAPGDTFAINFLNSKGISRQMSGAQGARPSVKLARYERRAMVRRPRMMNASPNRFRRR